MTGCRVLTLPSRISGNPVTRATGTTGTLALPRSAAVPPVEAISKPRSASPRASSTIPSLRYTESRALLFIRRPPLLTSPTEGGGNASACLAPPLCHRPPALFHFDWAGGRCASPGGGFSSGPRRTGGGRGGAPSWGATWRGLGMRVVSPRASRQTAIQVAAIAVTARE